jgi:hypothetical protein
MKIRFHIMPLVAMVALLTACEKDNYTEPKSTLSGQIVYNGEPIGVEEGQVRLQLWQPGFGKLAALDAQIAQDGSYSALLFDGSYKMVFPKKGTIQNSRQRRRCERHVIRQTSRVTRRWMWR